MNRRNACLVLAFALIFAPALGCNSPYRADRGALFGGLVGAGTGALIGDAVGNAGAGAAIGAGVGAISGAVVGSELDEIEARNQAMIEQQLGRQLAAGAVTIDDVLAMTRAGVNDELIVNHINAHGMARTLQASDLIMLQQSGVSTRVISAMQNPPPQPAKAVVVREPAPTPVIVEEYHYGPPVWRPYYGPHHYYRHYPPRSGVSWGLSFHN
jgi:hypothetical protein